MNTQLGKKGARWLLLVLMFVLFPPLPLIHPLLCVDIGDEYDATFAQAPISNRVILTTPNLIVGTSPNHANSLVFTTVHEHASSIGGEESPSSQEQLTASARLCDTFGPAKRCGIEFKRPFHIDTSLYGCLPMQLAQSRPTAKFATEVTDLKSGVSVGASSR